MTFQQVNLRHFITGHIGKGTGKLSFSVITGHALCIIGIVIAIFINITVINDTASLSTLHDQAV